MILSDQVSGSESAIHLIFGAFIKQLICLEMKIYLKKEHFDAAKEIRERYVNVGSFTRHGKLLIFTLVVPKI